MDFGACTETRKDTLKLRVQRLFLARSMTTYVPLCLTSSALFERYRNQGLERLRNLA